MGDMERTNDEAVMRPSKEALAIQAAHDYLKAVMGTPNETAAMAQLEAIVRRVKAQGKR